MKILRFDEGCSHIHIKIEEDVICDYCDEKKACFRSPRSDDEFDVCRACAKQMAEYK